MSIRLAALFVLGVPLTGSLVAADKRPGPLASSVSGVVAVDPRLHARQTGLALPETSEIRNVNTTNNVNAQNETTIDINPIDPNFIAGGVNDYRVAPNSDTNCGFARSDDTGLTWSSGILLGITRGTGGPFNYDAAGDPSVFYAGDGTLHFICLGFDRSFARSALLAVQSSDNGLTWSTPVAIVRSDSTNVFHDKEMLTIDTRPASPFYGRLYVQWTAFENNFTTNEIRISYSSDGGATWAAPTVISGAQTDVQGAHPAVAPDGAVYASWCSPCIGNAGLYVNRSEDGGVTWGAPVRAASFTGLPGALPGNLFRVNSFPTAAVDSTGVVYAVYADYASGNADIKLVRSTDQGATWSAPIRVNSRRQDDQFFQWMDISASGALWVCYYDQSWNNMNWLDMSCSRSNDGGLSFERARRVTTQSSNPANDGFGGAFIGDYNGLAVDANNLPRPLWTDTRAGNAEAFTFKR